jgi:hypothetical protein
MGPEEVIVIRCDNNVCRVRVPAPGFALVFLSDDALTELDGVPSKTFPTSVLTRTRNTAGMIDPAVLETSNGHSGMGRKRLGSTSRGSVPSAAGSLSEGFSGRSLLSWMFMIVGVLIVPQIVM